VNCDGSVSINPFVYSTNYFINSSFQNSADAKKSRDCDGTSRLDLLPMARGETKGNHIFLTVPVPSAHVSNAFA